MYLKYVFLLDPPELPKLKSIDVKGTNVTISWDPVDTCVPDFHSYNYRIYKVIFSQRKKDLNSQKYRSIMAI